MVIKMYELRISFPKYIKSPCQTQWDRHGQGCFPVCPPSWSRPWKKTVLKASQPIKYDKDVKGYFWQNMVVAFLKRWHWDKKKHCRYLWHSSFTQNTLRRHIFCRVVLNIPFSFVSQFIIQYLFNTVWNPKIPSKLFNRHLLLKNPLFWLSLFRNPLFVVNFLFWEILSLL